MQGFISLSLAFGVTFFSFGISAQENDSSGKLLPNFNYPAAVTMIAPGGMLDNMDLGAALELFFVPTIDHMDLGGALEVFEEMFEDVDREMSPGDILILDMFTQVSLELNDPERKALLSIISQANGRIHQLEAELEELRRERSDRRTFFHQERFRELRRIVEKARTPSREEMLVLERELWKMVLIESRQELSTIEREFPNIDYDKLEELRDALQAILEDRGILQQIFEDVEEEGGPEWIGVS